MSFEENGSMKSNGSPEASGVWSELDEIEENIARERRVDSVHAAFESLSEAINLRQAVIQRIRALMETDREEAERLSKMIRKVDEWIRYDQDWVDRFVEGVKSAGGVKAYAESTVRWQLEHYDHPSKGDALFIAREGLKEAERMQKDQNSSENRLADHLLDMQRLLQRIAEGRRVE